MPLPEARFPRRLAAALALSALLFACPALAAPTLPAEPEALLVRAYFHLTAEGGQGPLAALEDLDAYEAARKPAEGVVAGRGLAPALLLRARALRALGRYGEGVAAVDRLLLLPDPRELAGVSRAEAFLERGRCLAELGRSARALEDYGQALALEPGGARALLARGDLLFALGRAAEAEADYGRALQAEPDNAVALVNRGVARDEQGRHDEAEADFSRALRLDPGLVSAWTGRGVARSQLGEMAGMCADYREACARGGCRRLQDARAMGYCGEGAVRP